MNARRTLRRATAALLAAIPSRLTGVSILIYHSVSPDGPGFITDSVEGFEMQLRSLKRRGLRTVFASELPVLLNGQTRDVVCITLDDGYRDNYEYAFPLLVRYGIKATIFLSTAFIGGTRVAGGIEREMLSREQIEEMKKSGLIEFLPHTHTHPHLPAFSAEAVREEIEESKRIVEELTGASSALFAYPYGEYDAKTQEAVRSLGFSAALGVQPGIARPASDLYDLPRNALGDVSEAEFVVKTSDRLSAYLLLKRLV